jgi:hypothetical protein
MAIALSVLAAVVVPSGLVVLVGRANARTRPRAGDSPYRLPPGSPIAYILFAGLALIVGTMILGLAAAVVVAVIQA